jgi:hypothetical protein
MRRYEILLPLRFNDGTPVPDLLIGGALVAIREHFGAASFETQTIRGVWQHEGGVYRDDSCGFSPTWLIRPKIAHGFST